MVVTVKTKFANDPVFIRAPTSTNDLEIRIGDPSSSGSRVAILTTDQARAIAHALLAQTEVARGLIVDK